MWRTASGSIRIDFNQASNWWYWRWICFDWIGQCLVKYVCVCRFVANKSQSIKCWIPLIQHLNHRIPHHSLFNIFNAILIYIVWLLSALFFLILSFSLSLSSSISILSHFFLFKWLRSHHIHYICIPCHLSKAINFKMIHRMSNRNTKDVKMNVVILVSMEYFFDIYPI